MALNYLSLKNYAESNTSIGTLSVSTLTGSVVTGFSTIASGALTGSTLQASSITGATALGFSTIAGNIVSTNSMVVPQIQLNSTMISLGPNTQSTMVSSSNGSYASGSWSVTKTGLVNPKKLAVSSTGQYQLVVSETTGGLWLSSDSGLTWSALGASQGLPVLEGSAQWVAGAVSASGQQITLAVSGGSLWFSSDYGRTFAVSPQDTPDVWVPLNGSVSDLMGSSTVTATGSPGYVNVAQPGFTEQAIRLSNVVTTSATQYVRGTWAGAQNFTISGWFNPQSINSTLQVICSVYGGMVQLYINGVTNLLNAQIATGVGSASNVITTSFSLTANTWYYFTIIYQINGTCSFYVNNNLIGTCISSGNGTYPNSGVFSLGTYDTSILNSFNGLIADFRLYNRAVTYTPLPHLAPAYWLPMEGSVADAGSYALAHTATPFVNCAFDGVLTDAQGNSTVTAPGLAVSYVASVPKGVASSQSLALVNTAGGTADRYVRGTLNASSNITISFWFNPQTINGTLQTIFDTPMDIALYIGASNHLFYQIPSGGGTGVITVTQTSFTLTANTWYFVTMIFQTNGLCSLFVNNSLIGSSNNTGGYGTLSSSGSFSLGTYDNATTLAFNGYISNFRLHNTAFVQTPSPTLDPTIYLPLEGSVTDERGFSTVTATGSPAYTTSVRAGALGTQAINLANTAGGTATQYVRGTWAGAENFTISFWFYPRSNTPQVIFSSYSSNICSIQMGTSVVAYVPSGGGTNYAMVGATSNFSLNTWNYVVLVFQSNSVCSFYLNNALIGSVTNTQGLGTATTTHFVLGCADIGFVDAFDGLIDDFRLWNTAAAPHPGSTIYPTIYLPFEGSVADAQGASAVTATGISSADYTASVRTGALGIRAVNLNNSATVGGTASKYIQGTIGGSTNFTFSLWFNAQSLNAVQFLFSNYYDGFNVRINSGNTIMLAIPSNSVYSQTTITTTFTITTSTWYYVYVIIQIGGACSFYVNNILIGSANCAGLGEYSPSGTYTIGAGNASPFAAFNGYIDDFRIWNAAVPYVPVAVVNPVGSIKYVPGAVGQTALSLENTAGGTASNYVRGGWSGSSSFTVSCWFNSQSITPSNSAQIIFTTGGNTGSNQVNIYINGYFNNRLTLQIPNSVYITTNEVILQNVWYHVYIIVQPNGNTCYLYLNGNIYTTSASATYSPTGLFGLGTYEAQLANAFNGYIDDFRIYNAAIPYSALFPKNHTHLAMSGNGAYQMAANQTGSQSGQLWLSSDSGSTWALQSGACTPGLWSSLSASNSGKYLTAQSQPVVQPNQSGLVTSTWSQQGVTYTASASSNLNENYPAYGAFNNFFSSLTFVYSWASAIAYSGGNYIGAVSTTIQGGIGSVLGEWIQLQTSSPLVLQSYTYACGGFGNIPKKYYIVGSNDSSTWYPLQYVNMDSNPLTVNFTGCSTNILMNYTGRQTIQGQILGSGYTTAYLYTTQAFQYFRIVATNNFGDALFEFGEFIPNFIGGSITPNQSGLAAASWSQSGVGWTVTASSTIAVAGYEVYRLFNNSSSNSWACHGGLYNSDTGAYLGSVSTIIQGGIGPTLGEWFQIQASMPIVLQSYSIYTGALGRNHYVVGSNDGSTWYPLQYFNQTAYSGAGTTGNSYIILNYTGNQTIDTIAAATTAYAPYVTQAWQYFRLITTTGYNFNLIDYNEFKPVFTAGQNSSSTFGASWVPTLQTGDAFNVTKNLTITSAGTGWAQLPAFTPVSQGVTISCWFTLQSTPANYCRIFDAGATTGGGVTNYIEMHLMPNGIIVIQHVISNTVYYAMSSALYSLNTLNHVVWTIDGSGNNVLYFNNVSTVTLSRTLANQTYPYVYIGKSNNNDPYPDMTVTDFRMFNRALNAAEVSQLYTNKNYGQPALGPLVTSESGEYVLAANQSVAAVANGYLTNHQISSYSNPLLSGISGPIVDTAVSQSGQNMVLITSSRQNNLYYSRDYGATFTGLTIGSSSLASGLVPLARLPLDGSAIDLQESLSPATGAGTVTYSTSIVKVGSASAFFNNTAGSTTPTNYLNYTVPPALNATPILTMACWVYPTALPLSNEAFPIGFNNGAQNPGSNLYIRSNGTCGFGINGNSGSGVSIVSSTTITINMWSHLIGVVSGGVASLYVNGVLQGTAVVSFTPSLAPFGNPVTNLFVGALHTAYGAFAGYVDDVRIYTSALTAADVLTLYNNGTAVTNDRSWPMVSCSISNDGSYLTATNSAGDVYRLNSNSQGYSLAIGSQAGQVNQAQNAIAIGNQAGVINQSANSIILNASGSALNTNSSGFFVSPIGTTSGLNMELLGYGADSQVVRTGVTVAPGGNVGIGTTNPNSALEIYSANPSISLKSSSGGTSDQSSNISFKNASYTNAIITGIERANGYNGIWAGDLTFQNYYSNGLFERMRITAIGNVGIGTTNPGDRLHVYGYPEYSAIFLGQSATSDKTSILKYYQGSGSGTGRLTIGHYGDNLDAVGTGINILKGGNVGIGITNPSYKLHVVGDIYASANVIAMSDQRVKRDLQPLGQTLDRLSSLNGYTYFRDGKDEREMGLIAQEVLTVFPEAVHYDSQQDRYGVNYGSLIAPLLESIKDLKKQVDVLTHKVLLQEQQIATLLSAQ